MTFRIYEIALMRSLVISIAMIIAGKSLALPPVRPVLPPVAHDDAETTTNVPFAAWQDCAEKNGLPTVRRTEGRNAQRCGPGRNGRPESP